MDLKELLKKVVGIAVLVAAVWGITDYTLDEQTASLVQAIATIVLILYNRYKGRSEVQAGGTDS